MGPDIKNPVANTNDTEAQPVFENSHGNFMMEGDFKVTFKVASKAPTGPMLKCLPFYISRGGLNARQLGASRTPVLWL